MCKGHIQIIKHRCLTVSTSGNPKLNDIFKAIKSGIKAAERVSCEVNPINALFVGENKEFSSRSRCWHVVFSRDLSDDEKRFIKYKIESMHHIFPKPAGKAAILIVWGIENNDKHKNYIYSNQKHTYFKERKIRGN